MATPSLTRLPLGLSLTHTPPLGPLPHPPRRQALANTHDELGRRAVDIATPLCRAAILSRLNFYGRYEMRPGFPAHQSSTCIVRFATDHESKQEVALKFMRRRDHFERELACRRLLSEPAATPAEAAGAAGAAGDEKGSDFPAGRPDESAAGESDR